jgi:hypothetical protein
MPKQSKAQPNRAADGAKNTFEFYFQITKGEI